MTTAMAAHQESIHERLQPGPEEPLYLHHGASWNTETSDHQEEHSTDMSPYYNMPKRNKRKNFKPRCAPNATTFSDDSNGANCEPPLNGNDRTTPDQAEDETDEGTYAKIGVKNFSLLKGGAVDLSRRLSTDSNENIESNYQNSLSDDKKVDSFQRSYIHSLQMTPNAKDRTVLNFSNLQNKTFCAKNPFAISQLIKTNSPPRRRESDSDDEVKGQDINANERLENQEMESSETQQNGDTSNATNRILRDYAMNTMKELLGIYGLSSNEVADAISGQIRALEALQGKPFTQLPLSLKRRHDSGDGTDRSFRRSSSATEDEGSTNITPPKTPDNDIEAQRQRALQIINQQSLRLFRSQNQDEEASSDDGDQTLDLSVSRDADGQEQSTTSSAGNSVSEFEQQNILMRKNLEDLANLQMQNFFQKQSMMDADDSQERKLQASAYRKFQKESSLSAVAVDMEEDVTSSLNTLLDARPDSATPAPRSDSDERDRNRVLLEDMNRVTSLHDHAPRSDSDERDRIVWTYNAPISQCNGSAATSNSTSISDGMSQRSMSPLSPTSASWSALSPRATPPHRSLAPHHHRTLNGDMSLSEAVSNISSPDYQDQDDMFETGRECPRMELSDPSDSDSTILVSEPCHKRAKSNSTYSDHGSDVTLNGDSKDYRIVIQVKGPDKQNANTNDNVNNNNNSSYAQNGKENGHNSPENQGYQELCSGSDAGSDEGSDGDSLHSFHYSPKAVDIPSAERLAKRLYHLDGFKKSDVSRHLSKNNEFSRAVAEEYVKHFEFSGATLDEALRAFLARFALSGETQERERVLVHFSRRYLECNPGAFNSQDAVHTLTCAIMLLNTDLHGCGSGTFRRMSCAEFIENLAELNDGDNFPRDTLKHLYHAIRNQPLQWALDTEAVPPSGENRNTAPVGSNPFLDLPDQSRAVEYKKGYVMRKCCFDANGKKTPFGRRGWKMFYCTLRDLVLYLHKDEHGFRRSQMSDNLHNAIRIHHALATKATDYTKKQHVFRLQTADQAEYLFQTSDSKELCSWVETINFVCGAYSAPPLAGAVGSQRKFQRPLLPCTHTKLSMREQLADHEERAARLEEELAALRHSRDHPHAHRDKDHYLVHEIKRYRTYAYVMRTRGGGAGAEENAPALPERAQHPPP